MRDHEKHEQTRAVATPGRVTEHCPAVILTAHWTVRKSAACGCHVFDLHRKLSDAHAALQATESNRMAAGTRGGWHWRKGEPGEL
jgi:hypothetical protein